MKVFGLICIFLFMGVYELPQMKKEEQKLKQLITYYSILAIGFILSFSLVVHKAPISPSKIIEMLVKKVI